MIMVFAVPLFVQAAGLVPCGGYDAAGNPEPPCTIYHIFILIARVTNWLIGLAGVYAVFQIVIAGFWLVVSSGNEENVAKWKKGITNAVVGLVIVLGAYMFMNTAVNLLLAQNTPGKTVDFKKPLCYLTNGDQCLLNVPK